MQPRIVDRNSPQEQYYARKRKWDHHVKRVHQARVHRYIAIFALVFIIFGVQLGINISTAHRINAQIVATKAQLAKQEATNKKLKNQRDNLKDPDYVAKLIRYRFYYSKKGEEIYNVPESSKN